METLAVKGIAKSNSMKSMGIIDKLIDTIPEINSNYKIAALSIIVILILAIFMSNRHKKDLVILTIIVAIVTSIPILADMYKRDDGKFSVQIMTRRKDTLVINPAGINIYSLPSSKKSDMVDGWEFEFDRNKIFSKEITFIAQTGKIVIGKLIIPVPKVKRVDTFITIKDTIQQRKQTFSLHFNSPYLKTYIENNTKLKYTPSNIADLVIKVVVPEHSIRLNEAAQMWFMDETYPVLEISGSSCIKMKKVLLEYPMIKRRTQIESYIDNEIKNISDDKYKIYAKTLLQCIKAQQSSF